MHIKSVQCLCSNAFKLTLSFRSIHVIRNDANMPKDKSNQRHATEHSTHVHGDMALDIITLTKLARFAMASVFDREKYYWFLTEVGRVYCAIGCTKQFTQNFNYYLHCFIGNHFLTIYETQLLRHTPVTGFMYILRSNSSALRHKSTPETTPLPSKTFPTEVSKIDSSLSKQIIFENVR